VESARKTSCRIRAFGKREINDPESVSMKQSSKMLGVFFSSESFIQRRRDGTSNDCFDGEIRNTRPNHFQNTKNEQFTTTGRTVSTDPTIIFHTQLTYS
jgi:hypothetical protein